MPGEPHTWYCSIMGQGGEHRSYCFYKGEKGLDIYLQIREEADEMYAEDAYTTELILSNECLQVSFEDREQLDPHELALIKKLGIKFRGRGQWVSLKDYTAGWLPWLVSEDQAHPLHALLLKAMDVAMDCQAGKISIGEWEESGQIMPVFTLENDVWKMEETPVAIPENEDFLQPPALPQDWESLRFLTEGKNSLVCGTINTMQPTQKSPSSRAFFMKVTLLINPADGMILGVSTIDPENYAEYESLLINIFRSAKTRPAKIYFADGVSETLLTTGFKLAGIETDYHLEAAKMLDEVAESMFSMLGDDGLM